MKHLRILAVVSLFLISASYAHAQGPGGYQQNDPGYANGGNPNYGNPNDTNPNSTRITIKITTRTMAAPTTLGRSRVTRVRFTVHLPYAHTATTHTTHMRALRPATTVLSGSPAGYLLEQDRGSEAATMVADSTGPEATTVVADSTDVRGTDRLLAPSWDVGQQEVSAVETASADSAGPQHGGNFQGGGNGFRGGNAHGGGGFHGGGGSRGGGGHGGGRR